MSQPQRPSLTRGVTVPVHFPTTSNADLPSFGAAARTLNDTSSSGISTGTGSGQWPSGVSRQRSMHGLHGASSFTPRSPYPTPPSSSSSGAGPSHSQGLSFHSSLHSSHQPSPTVTSGSHHYPHLATPATANYSTLSSPTSQQPTTYPSYNVHQPRSTVKGTTARSPPPQQHRMDIQSTRTQHVLRAPVGMGFDSDRITISAKRGSVVKIVADRWELEENCHLEWEVQFASDADMSNIVASYDKNTGILCVTVGRLRSYVERDFSVRT